MSSLIAKARRVAFQGEPGAFGNQAAREALPHAEAVPKETFEDAVDAVRSGETDLAIIPIENSLHGRIADIHHLLPEAGLHIVGEHFVRINLQLLGLKGAPLSGVRTIVSQGPALGQCRKLIRDLKLHAQEWHDTAGSARHVAELGDPGVAAVASRLAGELYGLDVLKAEGYIRNYTVIVDPEKAGYDLQCFIQIGLQTPQSTQVEDFREAMRNMPEVLDCYHITGEYDYILRVVLKNRKGLENFMNKISSIAGVARIHTNLVLAEVKSTMALPLE